MASTRQSALDYLTNARKYLVGKLKNLSVILDNLNLENSKHQRVLIDSAVRRIQSERNDDDKTREILDSVIKQGEAACYEFLRVIYSTRKRTLDVDLHHWIISFPFSEDAHMDINYLQGPTPCHRYQAKLKSKARKISNHFWMANRNLFKESNMPDLAYMPLVLDTQGSLSPSKIKKLKSKKSKLSRRKKLRKYIPEGKAETSPSDLLKRDENILLVGKPGIGKTALTHEMLKLWAERDNKLDYMFYFDMRETSHIRKDMSLEDLLFNVFSEPEESKEEVLQDIKNNSDNVTLIFDGITDLSSSVVKRLVENDLLPDAKIILTCRPDDEEEFSSEDFLRVEVKGFSEPTIKTYLSAMLGGEQEKVLRNVELLTLCHVPMYALMVAACFSYDTPEDSPQPCTMTEIHINIVRHCLQVNSNNTKNKNLNSFINNKREEILSLAEVAFRATEGKTVNLTECHCEDSGVLSFLKPLFIKVAPTETITTYAFLHYTMQEFFAALWLVKNPDKLKDVFQQCLTEEKKHMKHLIPFMCRLLNEKSPSLMKCLIPDEELKSTSNWFFEEMIDTFFPHLCKKDDADTDVDILFLCQCLYESQCPEACLYLMHKLNYHLDLSRASLDPYPCCAVAYVVTQLKEKKLRLNLEDVMVSEQGIRRLFGCLKNAQWYGYNPLQQLWEIFLLSEGKIDDLSLLGLDENELHLPVDGKQKLFERAVKLMQKQTMKVNVCLHWERETVVCQSLCNSLFEALPYIRSLSFRMTYRGSGLQDQEQFHGTLQREERQLLLDLCLKAALHKEESVQDVVNTLLSLFSFGLHNVLLDFYQHVKNEGLSGVISKLRPLFQSAPEVWIIDLSERKTSILLEVLKLQSEKRQVKLTGFSYEESEVGSFLQCLPYISQLSFVPQLSEPSEEIRFFGNLFCAAAEREQQTGEKIMELLSSLCRYQTCPLKQKWCDFLLDLYSELETGLRDLPSLQSVFQSAPAVCIVNLSKRKASILLEVLKLQTEKRHVKLTGCSDQESEMRSFLQCLPYISQLSFSRWFRGSGKAEFFGNLFCAAAAAETEQHTGEEIQELLSSVCTYETFPLNDTYMDDGLKRKYQCDFLLDLYSHLKDYETKTGLSVLPSVQSVFQSAPEVWIIDLSERKASILLEVLKLQSEKRQVKLTGYSYEESEVRSFLQCLPYISQLSCDPKFFQGACTVMSIRSTKETEQLASLLQLLGYTMLLKGVLRKKPCLSVRSVLELCGSDVDLILQTSKKSFREASLLFSCTTQLHSLRLPHDMALLLCGWVEKGRVACPVTIQELSLFHQTTQPSEKVLLKVISGLASLLRYWTIRRLHLTEFCVPAQGLIPLLLHDGPVTIKLSEDTVQQLLSLLHKNQNNDLTRSFLSKVGGDLTSCCLNWELLHYLLQQSSAQTITVNLKKNSFLQQNILHLLPFLDRIVFKRLCPSFVLTAVREIYKARDSARVPSLLRSLDHVICLTCREMDLVDCAALLFTLQHSDKVKLNLMWSSIPAEETESIFLMLDKVSQLSVDRKLLLKLVHYCAYSDAQQGAAVALLRSLQHRLDLSSSSCVELSDEDQSETLSLSADDCRAVSSILRHSSSQDTQLILEDCAVEDSGLDLLFPVLDRVCLRVSKAVLLQLVSLVPVNSERDSVRRAESLCRALNAELDLSHSSLDQRAWEALALMLDFSAELKELDLSHCQLTDQQLFTLCSHLHKVQVLDLSHNNITDASTDMLLQLVSINPCIQTVRLFRNNIVDRASFKKDKQFEIW